LIYLRTIKVSHSQRIAQLFLQITPNFASVVSEDWRILRLKRWRHFAWWNW